MLQEQLTLQAVIDSLQQVPDYREVIHRSHFYSNITFIF